ncbi:MAG: hypothetical protein PVF33_11365, partial [Candidatus Latescibacterota bacterium]
MLTMRSVSVIVLLLFLTLPGAAASAGPSPSVGGAALVSERPGVVEVAIDAVEDGLAPLPKRRFYVAVPSGATVRAQRVGGTFETREPDAGEVDWFENMFGSSSGKWFPEQPVTVAGPFIYRNTRLVAVDCYLRQLNTETMEVRDWSGYRVVVNYPAGRKSIARADADPLLAAVAINGNVFPAPGVPARNAAQGGADPQFSKSLNWVKLEVERRGVYAVTGAELGQRVPLSSVGDPRTFRLFTGSGFEQKRDLTDPEATWRPGNWMTEVSIRVDGEDDGVFEAGDRVVFYGVGAEGWMDHFDPAAPDTVYHIHGRATANYYYLTWEGSFPGNPKRMAEIGAAPSGGGDRTTFWERLYVEQNKVSDYDFGGDFWLWLKLPRATAKDDPAVLDRVDILDLVPGVPQEFRTVAMAPFTGKTDPDGVSWDTGHHARYVSTLDGTLDKRV